MRCIFCKKPVIGNDGISLSGQGVCHEVCYQVDQSQQRKFKNLDISKLNDQELTDLKDIVLAEENSRNSSSDDIELF